MLKNINKLIMSTLLIGANIHIYSQTIPITLEDAIHQMTCTYGYKKIQQDSIIYSYKHQVFKASVLPQIGFVSTLPNYNRSISLVTQPEGYDKYITRSYATSNLGFNISQLIPFTGGTIAFSSNLERQDNFNLNTNKYAYYLNLFNVSYNQTLFSFNAYKWNQKSDNLTKSIEKISIYQQKEAIKQKIIELFFNLLIAQRENEQNKENLILYEYVFANAKKLYQAKRLSKEDMLASQIEYIKAKDDANDFNLTNAQNALKAYLNWDNYRIPKAIFNDNRIPQEKINIHINNIIEKVIKYNYTLKKDLNVLYKNIEIKQIKKSVSPTVSISIGSGYNSQFQSFSDVLNDKASRVSASLSIAVPIHDGGIGKYKKGIANIELKQINDQYKDDITNASIEFEKELQAINLLINSIQSNKESLNLIQQRLDIMRLNVEKGKIDVQYLMQTKVQQIRTFISYNTQIQKLYLLIYKYRYLSLTDVRNNKDILLDE